MFWLKKHMFCHIYHSVVFFRHGHWLHVRVSARSVRTSSRSPPPCTWSHLLSQAEGDWDWYQIYTVSRTGSNWLLNINSWAFSFRYQCWNRRLSGEVKLKFSGEKKRVLFSAAGRCLLTWRAVYADIISWLLELQYSFLLGQQYSGLLTLNKTYHSQRREEPL